MLNILCTYSKLHPLKLGGYGVICDADCFQMGRERKKGYQAGHPTYNKAWGHVILERGGRYRFDAFAHPGQGSERVSEITPLWDEGIADGSIVNYDSAPAAKSYVLDHPNRLISLLRINHKDASPSGPKSDRKPGKGFSWPAHLTAENCPSLYYLKQNEYRLVDCNTCYADGIINHIKTKARAQRGINRSTFLGFLKLEEFLLNCRIQGLDPILVISSLFIDLVLEELLRRFGVVSEAIRKGEIDEKAFKESMYWNWELYEEEEDSEESWDLESDSDSESESSEDEIEMWQCGGCEKVMKLTAKAYHRRCCPCYVGASDLIIEHSSTSCHCCVLHRFYNTYPKIHFKELKHAEKKRKSSSSRSHKRRKK